MLDMTEIRERVGIILLAVQTIKEEPEEASIYLEMIERSTRRVIQILDGRIEHAKQERAENPPGEHHP